MGGRADLAWSADMFCTSLLICRRERENNSKTSELWQGARGESRAKPRPSRNPPFPQCSVWCCGAAHVRGVRFSAKASSGRNGGDSRRQHLAYGNFVALAGREKFRRGKFARAERLDNFCDGAADDPRAPTDPVTVNGTCLMVARNVVTVATRWHVLSATHFASVSGGGGANRNSSTRKCRVLCALRIPRSVLWQRQGERQPPSPPSPERTFQYASEEVPSWMPSRRGAPPVSPSRKLGPMEGAKDDGSRTRPRS